ncbi:MAG: TIGR02147 family protein [Oligoflexales bacterium]|nr:TIGR02147 family protein [Oligoflexales bacterium]
MRFRSDTIYKQRKKINNSYSLRKFSKDLGFTSPSYASVLIEGTKKISKKNLEKICTSLNLESKKKEYFFLLFEMAFADKEEKAFLIKRAQEINSSLSGFIINDELSYYLENSACRHISLLVQIYKEDFIAEPLWIDRHLKTKIPLDDISKALKYLIKYDFIKKVDGSYVNSKPNLVSKDEIPNASIRKAQLSFLHEAIEGLKFPINDREYGNISVPIHKSFLPELKEKIKHTRNEFKSWISERNGRIKKEEDKAYLAISINFQMYPLIKTRKN